MAELAAFPDQGAAEEARMAGTRWRINSLRTRQTKPDQCMKRERPTAVAPLPKSVRFSAAAFLPKSNVLPYQSVEIKNEAVLCRGFLAEIGAALCFGSAECGSLYKF
jgi:cytochrome c-type biogenesis protein CcmH/NrfG